MTGEDPRPPISVPPAVGPVVAGGTLDVLVSFDPDRPVDVTEGDVQLVRTTAVTPVVRNLTGAGSRVSLRSSAVISRADLGITGPLAPGQRCTGNSSSRSPRERDGRRRAGPA
jgi:hypothetical protein